MIEKYGQVIIKEDGIDITNFTFNKVQKEARIEALLFAKQKIDNAIRELNETPNR